MIDTLYLARPRGFCAGVVMAIDAVKDAARENRERGEPAPTVYHSIVHNRTVVERLGQEEGVAFVEELTDVPPADGGEAPRTVVFSAHGVSPAVRAEAVRAGLATVDATCPLVTKVHSEARKYAARGYHILLIGDSTRHQEVIGTRGEAPEQTTVVSVLGNRKLDPGLADPETVEVPDPDRVVVLTQTTLSVDDTMRTVALLKRRFPTLVEPAADDLCYATKNRQDAVRRIAGAVDLMLVVTSDTSSNGMRLLELAQDLCPRARRIETASDIREPWLDGVTRVGVTSAASTPDDLVQEVVAFFRRRNPDMALVEEGEWESVAFRKPRRAPPGGPGA
ncbi:MAG TPA: 4-hydroxy-3-methylbut-2-enyl diphosphate reductase [Trueperaceae bacterium]|nr:4-hydroxy-3-methylbut-2-enyl diphosphate reductase [Trueperaceae bacterium]